MGIFVHLWVPIEAQAKLATERQKAPNACSAPAHLTIRQGFGPPAFLYGSSYEQQFLRGMQIFVLDSRVHDKLSDMSSRKGL